MTKGKNYSPSELLRACKVEDRDNLITDVSIGMALDRLISLGSIGPEFQGNCDGIDALCYHLDGITVKDAMKILQKILERVEEYKD